MEIPPQTERRRHPRKAVSLALSFDHAPSARAFPARSVDVSAGGLLMLVPVTAPVQAGHTIRLRFEPTSPVGATHQARALSDAVSRRSIDAEVVRVDRGRLLGAGQLAIAVRFT